MSLSLQLEKLIAGPRYPDNDFIVSGHTYRDVYSIAGYFQQHFSTDVEEFVCLCVNDRAIIAGALLAAMTRPVTLVIPYSDSASVLARMHQNHPFSRAIISDPETPLPRGAGPLFPDRREIDAYAFDGSFVRHADSTFVRLFTGGSTNTPRIWSKTIRNLLSEALYHAGKLGASPDDRFVATVPPTHIYGLLFSLLTPLAASAAVIDGAPGYPHEIQNAAREHRATVLVSIPLHYKMLAEIQFAPESLRLALSSAGRLDAADSRAFYRHTGLGITEIFGSTETGGIASRLCRDSMPGFRVLDCIDWKIENHLLAIRSEFISPELPVDPEGYFVTSDRVKPAGPDAFELGGRADRIIKVGGKRVDLDEVCSAITGIPGVKDAAIVAVDSSTGRENEICALVAAEISGSEIRRQLRHRIQDYAMPRRIRIADAIPVSATGKYDSTEIRKLLQSDSG